MHGHFSLAGRSFDDILTLFTVFVANYIDKKQLMKMIFDMIKYIMDVNHSKWNFTFQLTINLIYQ